MVAVPKVFRFLLTIWSVKLSPNEADASRLFDSLDFSLDVVPIFVKSGAVAVFA
jgi:hypothetical protein